MRQPNIQMQHTWAIVPASRGGEGNGRGLPQGGQESQESGQGDGGAGGVQSGRKLAYSDDWAHYYALFKKD